MIGAGGLAGVAIFAATIALILTYVPAGSLRPLQVADGIAFACLLAWFASSQAQIRQHNPPAYEGFLASLEIEVRAPASLLEGHRLFFARIPGGYAEDHCHPERTREEGGYLIVPLDLRIISVHDWLVTVRRTLKSNVTKGYTFQLAWHDYPPGNVPWSDWIEPVLSDDRDSKDNDDMSLRYRWVLMPVDRNRSE